MKTASCILSIANNAMDKIFTEDVLGMVKNERNVSCAGKIDGFEDYISIFRAAGISVTLLLQSESQLTSMYGDGGGL